METEFANREKKGRTYLICPGTFACHIGREIDKMGIENMHVWLMDGNAGGFISSCIRHSQTEDRFILLVACGGKTEAKLISTSIVELEKWNQKFSAIAVLPSLLEGGINIARTMWIADRLSETAKRTFFIENNFPSNDDLVTIKEVLSTLTSKVYSMVNCAIDDVDRQGEGRSVLDDYREKSMKNDEKIEKELFLEQEPCPEQIQDKKTTIDIFDKEIIKWKPMDNNVRKGVDKNELAFKCIVAMLIVIAPFILFYELGESFWFRCSSKKRKEEFKQMERERAKYAKKHSPKEERDFYRNNDRCVIHYSTSQDIYPKCDISIWVPETKVNDYPRVPWMDTRELYSIKMPYTFHSYWADGYVSDLEEADWLADFKMKWGLVNAISVINYDSNGYETIFRSRKAETFFLDTFPFDDEERTPLECFVELLTDKKPMDGLEYEKVLYRFVPMGEFRLERKSYDRLTGSSRKKLGRILDEYGLSKFRFV